MAFHAAITLAELPLSVLKRNYTKLQRHEDSWQGLYLGRTPSFGTDVAERLQSVKGRIRFQHFIFSIAKFGTLPLQNEPKNLNHLESWMDPTTDVKDKT